MFHHAIRYLYQQVLHTPSKILFVNFLILSPAWASDAINIKIDLPACIDRGAIAARAHLTDSFGRQTVGIALGDPTPQFSIPRPMELRSTLADKFTQPLTSSQLWAKRTVSCEAYGPWIDLFFGRIKKGVLGAKTLTEKLVWIETLDWVEEFISGDCAEIDSLIEIRKELEREERDADRVSAVIEFAWEAPVPGVFGRIGKEARRWIAEPFVFDGKHSISAEIQPDIPCYEIYSGKYDVMGEKVLTSANGPKCSMPVAAEGTASLIVQRIHKPRHRATVDYTFEIPVLNVTRIDFMTCSPELSNQKSIWAFEDRKQSLDPNNQSFQRTNESSDSSNNTYVQQTITAVVGKDSVDGALTIHSTQGFTSQRRTTSVDENFQGSFSLRKH